MIARAEIEVLSSDGDTVGGARGRGSILNFIVLSVALASACGARHGAPEGSPGHVSAANQTCASLFCSAEEEVDSDGKCAPSCVCGGYEFAEPSYDAHDLHALRSWRLLNPADPSSANPFGETPEEHGDAPAYCAAVPVDASPAVRTYLSLIHISEPTRPPLLSRMPSSA